MNNNRFDNSGDFEDIFSNTSSKDKYEDISSSSKKYEDISSNSSSSYDDKYFSDDFKVKYNSAVQNRRRQQYEYEDVSEIYSENLPEDNKNRGKGKGTGKKKKMSPKKRNTIIAVVCVILVLFGSVGLYGANIAHRILGSINTQDDLKDNEFVDNSELYKNKKQINVLLVGADAEPGETISRSDSMMLLTLDNENKQIKLTSFLRDSYVQIAGHKKAKLNSAFARQDGIQTLIDTLELNFKVDIPYYAIVDFSIFEKGIDLLGGIEVEVTQKESNFSKRAHYYDELIPLEAGSNVHLNGKEALWYSRMRYLDSDFMRTKRQQKVISAAITKTKEKNLNELVSIAEQLIPLVKTNVSPSFIMKNGIAAFKNKAYNYPVFKFQVPAEGTWKSQTISGQGSCLVLDVDKNTELLHQFLDNAQVSESQTDSQNKKAS